MKRLFAVLCLFLLAGCLDPPATPSEHDHTTLAESQLYTCGMHPQVVQDSPGTCPICSMNLTPMAKQAGERKVKHWVAPMDPTYIRDEPGKSPMGMDLVPVYEKSATGRGTTVVIDPGVVQNMGVRTQLVERQTVFRHLRTIGEVEVGEDEISVVNLRYGGWVERIRVNRTGDPVKRGQTLFEVYSPELVAAQEELLLAIRTQGADSRLAQSARRKLELWDLSTRDIDNVVASGEVKRTFAVRAPRSGFVLHKNIVDGARVNAGQDLYRIGNLQRIWVTAEVYEFDAPWVAVGQTAQMELSFQKGRVLEGKVSYIYPTLNKASRTLTIRLEFDNPGIALKPGMFATVYIEYRRHDNVLALPTEAILHSGKRELVFVDLGDGHFEPREITTGLVGDRHLTEVLEGLSEGERVVASGQFLIDSESQLQEAIAKLLARRAGVSTVEIDEQELWTCPMHPEVLTDEPGRCPECGMDLVPAPDGAVLHAVPQDADALYACPMHPNETSDEPGRCGICNMFLVKQDAP
jgi:Cu(I)/Ag(I) efflux system membrane fusion protein/cobalt-zinc-cadmium efflux system membrane fusion protein